jgi:hypothetical protein
VVHLVLLQVIMVVVMAVTIIRLVVQVVEDRLTQVVIPEMVRGKGQVAVVQVRIALAS